MKIRYLLPLLATLMVACSCSGTAPERLAVARPCSACPTCNDGIQNQGETGVDCGGPCAACYVDAGAGGTDAGSDAGSDGGACPPGGESTAVLSTCTRTPDTSIYPTTYQYGSDPRNLVDIYMPPGATGPVPLVVNVPGGGYTGDGGGTAKCPNGDAYSASCQPCGGSPNPCATVVPPDAIVPFSGRQAQGMIYFCRVIAGNLNGIAPVGCAVIDYRLMSGNYPSTVNAFPAAVNDGHVAQAWIVANASARGIDPARIAWGGYSAGAGIAGKVAKAGGVKLWFSYYGNLYFDTPGWWSASNPSLYNYLGCANGDTACVATHAPSVNVTPTCGDPPALMSHSEADPIVSVQMSRRYLSEAHAAGVNATKIEQAAPISAHGYPPTYMGPFAPGTCTLIYEFLPQL